MKAFFCKLVPPRPTFAQDMTDAERGLMQEHAAYWQDWMGRGHVVTFGLVADPAGAFGIAVVEVNEEAEVLSLTRNDPTVVSGQGFRFEIYPMPVGAAHR